MEGKVAVLGDADFVMPFSSLGLDTFKTNQASEDVVKNAQKILEGNYTLIIVAENVAAEAQEVFSAKAKSAVPCVVVVPFTTESTGFATQALGEILKLATGINILQNN
ncbi:MAG: V-type ATP synthase subunit F [Planctomycetota bacterium]|jgi:vacuolar-type H+-ATPase subunit F/Vma7